jgi:hypothetical protein
MITVLRKEFQMHPVTDKIYQVIKEQHVVAAHTEKNLYDNRFTKDFCEMSRHFAILRGTPQIFISYDVSSWYREVDRRPSARISIDQFIIYDTFVEYESCRVRELSSKDNVSRSGGLNLN